MTELYCKLIISRTRTFDQVREEFKEAVEERLKELGYDADGELLNNETH
jgi:hypothetical protein